MVQGCLLAAKGSLADAQQAFNMALQKDATCQQALYNRGYDYRLHGSYKIAQDLCAACQCYQESIVCQMCLSHC